MADAEKFASAASHSQVPSTDVSLETRLNASGHPQELDQNFGLWSVVGFAITSGATWVPIGGSIVGSPRSRRIWQVLIRSRL